MKDQRQVLIIDDHPLFASAMGDILRGLTPSLDVRAVGSLGELERTLAGSDAPDMVILDLDLPDSTVATTVASVRRILPQVRLICVSAHDDERRMHHALASGADGFLSKALRPAQLVRQLRAALEGRQRATRSSGLAMESPVSRGQAELSARQREVMDLMACGWTNKAIAQRLGMAPGTVKVHVRDICARLEVHNRTEAVALYLAAADGRDRHD